MRTAARCCRLTLTALAVAAGCGGEDVPRPTGPSSIGPIPLSDGQTVGGPARRLGIDDGPRFSGVAFITLQGQTCSGSLVVPATVDLAGDGPAYLLTAGHCVLGAGGSPNAVVGETKLEPLADRVRFRYFRDSVSAATEVAAKRVVFASMKGVDLAIVELAPSRSALRQAGVVPFVLSPDKSAEGEEIAFAGHPQVSSPDWTAVLGACRQLREVPLVLEGGFHWYDVAANDCQGIESGVSGSPVFSLATGMVVGVVNTKAETGGALPPCALSQPCEAGRSDVSFVPGTNYAIPTADVDACFDAVGAFDVTLRDCPLDRGIQVEPLVARVDLPAAPGQALPFEVVLAAHGPSYYRAAVVPAATADCRDTTPYGAIRALTEAPVVAATVPGDPGISLLCLQAGAGADPTAIGWQDARTPTVIELAVAAPR